MNIPWTPQEDAILTERYANGANITKDVMPLLPNRTYNAIRSRAQKYLEVAMKKPFAYNHTFFAIPNEINCVIAGFLAADGCVSQKGRLTLGLARKDRKWLEMIVNKIEFTGNIYDYNRAYSVVVKKYGKETPYSGTIYTSTIQIQCPDLCADLAKNWNIVPLKTHTLMPPPLNDLRLKVAFLSGFIDGDGWIVNEKEDELGVYAASIGVMGTKEMMEWTKSIFDSLVPRTENAQLQPTESENIYEYKASGAKAYWLAKIFLSMNIPRLDRKWDKIRAVIERVEGGQISTKLKTNIAACKPTKETLELFGLSDTQPIIPLASYDADLVFCLPPSV